MRYPIALNLHCLSAVLISRLNSHLSSPSSSAGHEGCVSCRAAVHARSYRAFTRFSTALVSALTLDNVVGCPEPPTFTQLSPLPATITHALTQVDSAIEANRVARNTVGMSGELCGVRWCVCSMLMTVLFVQPLLCLATKSFGRRALAR